MLKGCSGKDFEDRRDAAIFRVFLNTGPRLAEMASLVMDDVKLDLREIIVLGKGRKGRALPLGPKAIKALDRYLRSRAPHKDADLPWVWLGPKGRLTNSGIAQMVKRRSTQSRDSPAYPPTPVRHTFSHFWLANGGTEHNLAKINGWTSLQMVGRYAASADSADATFGGEYG